MFAARGGIIMEKHMKSLLVTFILLFNLPLSFANTGTGTSISGPGTMGHPSYPNSGQLQRRSNDMTGSDMSNSSLMGSDVDPRVPTQTPRTKASNQRSLKGPYDHRDTQHVEAGPKGKQAQEAAREGFEEVSEEEVEQKQQGE
jgi:hypothetical protein